MDSAACFHCGLPVPAGPDIQVPIDGALRSMCCNGCATVARLISSSGLGAYYRYRDTPADTVDETAAGASQYAVFDEPEAQAEFVARMPDGSARAELAVDGIHCAACTWLLEHHLVRQPGLQDIRVSLAERRASVTWDPAQLPLSELMARIRALGYRPRPFLGSTAAELLRAENRSALRRLGVAGIVQMQIGMFAIALYAGAFGDMEPQYRSYLRWASLVLCIPVVFYSSVPFFRGALRGLRHRAPGMDLPIALAIGLAFASSTWFTIRGGGEVYFDSVAMFTFLILLGRYLEMRARRHAGMASADVLALVPSAATRLLPDDCGSELVPVGRLRADDRILIRPGEALPADGLVLEGSSHVDESSLSGESFAIAKRAGDTVSAGTLNIDGSLTVAVRATGLQTRLGAILNLLDRAQRDKPAVVQMADRISTWFVLAVLLLAAASGWYWLLHEPARALEIVLSVLVVSCPCALSLATPAAVTTATTALKKRGFLITRAHALAALAEVDTVVFDKTGTLTTGAIELLAVYPLAGLDKAACLDIAAALEQHSEHPIARAFALVPGAVAEDFRAFPGQGIEARLDASRWRLGAADFALAGQQGLEPPGEGKWVLLAEEGNPVAWFRLGDSLRADAPTTVATLADHAIRSVVLSGDAAGEVARAAAALGIGQWKAGCSAQQKLVALEQLRAGGHRVLMVGDGVNDAAVLAGAEVSIAMANAADLSRASADCLLLTSGLSGIPEAIALARRTRQVIRQNLAWAVLYNLGAIPFAAAGLVPPWLAALGMSASSLLVVVNALRLRQHDVSRASG